MIDDLEVFDDPNFLMRLVTFPTCKGSDDSLVGTPISLKQTPIDIL